MALVFLDSFDYYVTADFLNKWTAQNSYYFGAVAIQSAAGRHSSAGFRASTGNGNANAGGGLWKLLATAPGDATCIIGCSCTAPTAGIGTAGMALLSVRDGTTPQVTLRINSDTTVSACRGGTGGTVLGTSGATSLGSTSAYLEMKVLVHPSAGTVDVRVNGTSVLALTGQNTRNTANSSWNGIGIGAYDQVFNCATATAVNFDFDDLYVCDGTGSAPWNTFLGDVAVSVRRPTGASANGATNTQWTPSAGSNWQNVDDAAWNGDTDYNSALTSGLTDTFVTEDVPTAGSTVYAVQMTLIARKTDAGVCTLAPVVRCADGSAVVADRVGTAVPPATAYSFSEPQIYSLDPGTNAAWTEAGFNAAEFGYKRVS